jgi:hypothetical protein
MRRSRLCKSILWSSRLWHRVVLYLCSNILEQCIAQFFRVDVRSMYWWTTGTRLPDYTVSSRRSQYGLSIARWVYNLRNKFPLENWLFWSSGEEIVSLELIARIGNTRNFCSSVRGAQTSNRTNRNTKERNSNNENNKFSALFITHRITAFFFLLFHRPVF